MCYPELKDWAISFKTLIGSVGGVCGKYLFSFRVTICRWCSTFLSSFLLFFLLPLSTSANLCSRFFLWIEAQGNRKKRIRHSMMLANTKEPWTQPDTMADTIRALAESGDPTLLFHLGCLYFYSVGKWWLVQVSIVPGTFLLWVVLLWRGQP